MNIFTSMCHSFCPQARGVYPSMQWAEGYLPVGPGGVYLWVQGGSVCLRVAGVNNPSPGRHPSGQTATPRDDHSYWNAFLLDISFTSFNKEAIFGFMQSWMPSSCLSCRISCSTTPGMTCTSSTHCPHAHVICMLSAPACHLHVIWTCHLHLHVIHTCTCHPHIICSTPHGQHGPKLSFYSDRIWLLNEICHKNVELFHFRII